MAQYLPTLNVTHPERLPSAKPQPGQWINYEGARGRYMGVRRGCVWIAWNATATKRFAKFAAIFNGMN